MQGPSFQEFFNVIYLSLSGGLCQACRDLFEIITWAEPCCPNSNRYYVEIEYENLDLNWTVISRNVLMTANYLPVWCFNGRWCILFVVKPAPSWCLTAPCLFISLTAAYTFNYTVNSAFDVFLWNQYLHRFPLFVFLYLSQSVHLISFSSLSALKVSSHSEPSSQSLSLQQPAQQPPPPPPPPPQPQYGLPVPESRDKQLCFSDFEDLSASFRSLYKCVFEQSFSQQGGCRVACRFVRGLACICSLVSVKHLNWHMCLWEKNKHVNLRVRLRAHN